MQDQTVALLLAVTAAVATMLGWVIAVARVHWPQRVIGAVIAAAALAMILLSSLELLPSALEAGPRPGHVVFWAVLGAVFVVLLRLTAGLFDAGGSPLHRSALLVAVALSLHNIPEGAATFAAALVSPGSGLVTALAVGLHNIPEGLAIAAMVIAAGGSRMLALVLTGISMLGEISGALLTASAATALPDNVAAGLLAFVAGIMITVSVLELLPSAFDLLRPQEQVQASGTDGSEHDGPAHAHRRAKR